MKIHIVCIGKIKEKYFSNAVEEYAKRMSKYADFSIDEIEDAPPSKSVEEQQKIESDALLKKAKGFKIALDSRGKQLSSEEIALLFKTECNKGVSEFSLLIGGSHGFTDELRKNVNLMLSFSKQTFPHQLFRVMVCEQVYRAMCINANTPYHK